MLIQMKEQDMMTRWISSVSALFCSRWYLVNIHIPNSSTIVRVPPSPSLLPFSSLSFLSDLENATTKAAGMAVTIGGKKPFRIPPDGKQTSWPQMDGLIRRCCAWEPSDRPTSEQALAMLEGLFQFKAII